MTEQPPVYNIIEQDLDGIKLANDMYLATLGVITGGVGMLNLTENLDKMVERRDWGVLFSACEALREWATDMHRFCNALQVLDGYRYLMRQAQDDDDEEKSG